MGAGLGEDGEQPRAARKQARENWDHAKKETKPAIGEEEKAGGRDGE